MSQPGQNLTLRNKLNESERLTRELIHHIEHGFIPKVHTLRRTARHGNDPREQDQITDKTIRSTVEKTLQSDDFTQQLSSSLLQYLESIDDDLRRVIGN